MTKRIVDSVIVSFTKVEDKDNPTNGVLVVGRKRPNESMEIVNAIEGIDAEVLYKKLITKK